MRALARLALLVLLSYLFPVHADDVDKAMELAASGRPEQAMALLDSLLARDPNEAEACLLRGTLRLEKQDWEGSLADLDRALQLDPSRAETHFLLGYWYAVDGKDHRALAYYDRAIELAPGEPRYLYGRATAHERMGNLSAARDDYQALLRLDPTNETALRDLEIVERALGGSAVRREASDAGGAAPEEAPVIFNNGNSYAVVSGARTPTPIRFDRTCHVTEIVTYHWNDARGATPGRIRIADSSGRELGSWTATGRPGQGGVANTYWVVTPEIVLPRGEYLVSDTSPATWAQNSASGGVGFVTVRGRCDLGQHAPASVAAQPRTTTQPPAAVATTAEEIGRARIGPEGGSVVVPGEVSIEFPAGALAQPQQVVIQRQYTGADGALYSVTLDGGDALLAVPALIRYTLPPTTDPGTVLVLQQVGPWMTVFPGNVDPATGQLVVEADHFSDQGYWNREATKASLLGTYLARKFSLTITVGLYVAGVNPWVRVGVSAVALIGTRWQGWSEAPREQVRELVNGMEGPVSGGGITIYWDDATLIESGGLAAYYDAKGNFLRFVEDRPQATGRAAEVRGALGRVAERRYVPNAVLFALADLQYSRRWQAAAGLPDPPEMVVRIRADLDRDEKGLPLKAEWDGLTLSIHRDMINKAYGSKPVPGALDEMRALLAHEYWHASREGAKTGLLETILGTQPPTEPEEAVGVALESLQAPEWSGFLQQHPWRDFGEALARGMDAEDNTVLEKAPGALWPFAKFVFHRGGGGPALLEFADGTQNDSTYDDRFRRFALSLLTADEQYRLGASEQVTLPSGESYASNTGWGALQLHQLVDVRALEHQLPPGQVDIDLPPAARSLRVVGFLVPPQDPAVPGGPLIVRRLVARATAGESIWAFPPVDTLKNWQPPKSSVLRRNGPRGVVVPREVLDTGTALTLPVALLGLRPSASESSPLLAYRLSPPAGLTIEPAHGAASEGAEGLRIRWQPPTLGTSLQVATALAGYQVLGRRHGETQARILAELRYEDFRDLPEEAWDERPAIAIGATEVVIAADATGAVLPAALLAAYPEIGLRSVDGAMRDKADVPLTSETSWLAGPAGQIAVSVNLTYDELGRPNGPTAGSKPMPDAEVTWSWTVEGRRTSESGRADSRGRLTISGVPFDVDVTLSARGERRVVRCVPRSPVVRVTFGWDGQPISDVPGGVSTVDDVERTTPPPPPEPAPR